MFITNLAATTTTTLASAENKTLYVSNLVKKKKKKQLTITQKLMKLKRKLWIMIMINVTLNKMNQVSYQKKVKAISTKGLTIDLIKIFSILNRAKYFSSGIFQNY